MLILDLFLSALVSTCACMTAFKITPRRINEAMTELPPEDTNGNGFPVVGRTPTVQPMFKSD